MKAKVKATGEIINVFPTNEILTSKGIEMLYIDNSKGWSSYVESELEFIIEKQQKNIDKEIDWEQRRYEISKNVLSGVVVNEAPGHYEQLAKMAVLYADALIAELKKGGGE